MEMFRRAIMLVLVAAMLLSTVACGRPAAEDSLHRPAAQSTEPEAGQEVPEGGESQETTEPSVSVENLSNPDTQTEDTAATEPADESTATTATEPKTDDSATTATEPKSDDSATTVTEPESDDDEAVATKPTESATEPTEPENEESTGTGESAPVIEASGDYNKGIVLVKVKDTFREEDLGSLAYTGCEQLYKGSKWYVITLADPEKTVEAVSYLTALGTFDKVDYDYIMATDKNDTDVSGNPDYASQTNLGLHNIPYGWTQNGKHPGGSPDVIVAVIDTGVDYNHLDLRNNIWINNAEIPDNGRDDDNNGYVDDVYGWNFVGENNAPMDDNGHGTHVAGIIAAENNKLGGIGIAYNCKVMVLKAGNSSGYFNNSDIAEAIQYAYMNGASVINMSFGGSQISLPVEEALEGAYNSCILVAAAGNDSACNHLGCTLCMNTRVSYPAALPYVIGVMSTDPNGKQISTFSNYDHYPYDSVEYEVYAVGEAVKSTWPNNKYTALNGTSMAAPTVAGIAALLRSYYTDRELYSTKYIQSQIVNTGTLNPFNLFTNANDTAHSVVDLQAALNDHPKPEVNLYGFRIDDSTKLSNRNNGNGVVDAGETIRLYLSLHNRGGVAADVNVTMDANRSNGLTDPYITFLRDAVTFSDIGTYSLREAGADQYFEIVVSSDCPNDYLTYLNVHYTYSNGMDEKDTETYSGDGAVQFNVSRGFHLPSLIDQDTVYTADRLYIVGEDVVIPEGVTVTFEEGCEIQFYDDREYYNSPRMIVYGTLRIRGTKENMVKIAPNEHHAAFRVDIVVLTNGVLDMEYADTVNLYINETSDGYGNISGVITEIHNSALRTNTVVQSGFNHCIKYYNLGIVSTASQNMAVDLIDNCVVDFHRYNTDSRVLEIVNSYIIVGAGGSVRLNVQKRFEGNTLISEANRSLAGNYAMKFGSDTAVSNNRFLTATDSISDLKVLKLPAGAENNYFSDLYRRNPTQAIDDYYDASGNPIVDINGSLADPSTLWPYVVSMEMLDKDGNPITSVGRDEILVRVTFNRPMDTARGTYLTFGTIEPYADYRIDGDYVSDTVWEGTYSLKAQIENGQNFLMVNNACAAEDPTKTVFGEYQLHEFTVDTTEAMAMNLQAVALDTGIQLTFAQDDYDTLLGYNIYRSEDKDGNFVKLNPTIILPEENTFLDDNAEPGKTYWYTYTVVLSDFTESNPAGKVQATAKDTMAPSVYHTPVNQGYENNNLVISCTASDNVGVRVATLYYRTVGEETWKSLTMSKQNDKYSATIFGSEVTLAGIEYYIVVDDGISTVAKGSAEIPYTVVIKAADSLLGKGDVDGNGTVTTKDALMLMQCLNEELLLSDDEFKRADLNGDGVLAAAEALRILQYVNGKVKDLEM